MRLIRLAAPALLAAALLLSGCSTYVEVASDPEGAEITSADGRESYGPAPVSVPFDRDALEASGGSVPGFVATWPSGARAATESPYVVRDLRHGASVELRRPADAPGLEEDLRHALRRAQDRAEKAEEERRRMELYMHDGPMHGPFFAPGFIWMRP